MLFFCANQKSNSYKAAALAARRCALSLADLSFALCFFFSQYSGSFLYLSLLRLLISSRSSLLSL